GGVTFGGTLNVAFINGYTPVAGDSLTLVTYTTHSGTFAHISGLSGRGAPLTPHYNSNDFTLVALAGEEEPSPEAPMIPDRDAFAEAVALRAEGEGGAESAVAGFLRAEETLFTDTWRL